MPNKKNNIYKLLLNNKKVNNYTKMLLILNNLYYFKDFYIPNKKLMNMLGIHKKNVIQLLNQLKEDKIIYLMYKGRKRYFGFCSNEKEEIYEEYDHKELYDYNWLEEE